MPRIKIKVNTAALQQRTKSLNVIIGSGTTAHGVVCKVLDKCSSNDPPSKLQLWAVVGGNHSPKEQLLEDSDKLADLINEGNAHIIQFTLKYKPIVTALPATGLVRVYHQIDQDFETFQSLIVSQSMTARDVVQLALTRVMLDKSHDVSHDQFELLQRAPEGERVIEEAEHPLQLASTNGQLFLRRKPPQSPNHELLSDSLLATGDNRSPPLSKTTKHNFSTDSEPVTVISSTSEIDYPSEVSIERGKVQLHSELIEALHNLASQLESRSTNKRGVMKREDVLEQAVVEQSQILDMMQVLVTSLENENKSFRDKIDAQGKTILELASWEAKAKKTERQLSELTSNFKSSMSTTKYKKVLAEKDIIIAELRSKSSLSANTRLLSIQASLERERVRAIELEEELSTKQEELVKLKGELSSRQSVLIEKESEVLHLRHEMKAMKKLESQQQELVLQQRTALADKDGQLATLSRALKEEEKLCKLLRKKQQLDLSISSQDHSKVGDSIQLSKGSTSLSSCLFEQVLGRDITAIEIIKDTEDTEIGFSFSKVDLPVSSKLPCLIVKAVKQDSLVFGQVRAGDEILEVNQIFCRGPNLDEAIECLQKGKGTLRLVVARDHEPSLDNPLHSAPSNEGEERLWATALTGVSGTTYESFTAMVSTVPSSETTKYISIPVSPPAYTLLTSHNDSPLTSNEETMSKSDVSQPAYESLQLEFADIQDQLDESEHACLELETELEECQSEMENIKMESDLLKAENYELQQQVSGYEEEIIQVQKNLVDLQSLLITLQNQASEEQQRTASYENQNKILIQELEEIKEKHKVAYSEVCGLREELERLKLASTERDLTEERSHRELEKLNAESNQLKADITLKELKIEQLTKILEQKSSEYEHSSSQMRLKVTELETELAELKSLSSQATASVKFEQENTLSQLKLAKNLLVEAERSESELKLQMRYLEQAADTANEQLSEHETKLKSTEAELSGYKGEVENLSVKNKSLSLGLKHTQSKLEAKEHTLSRLQAEVDDLRGNSAKLNTQISQLKMERKKLESSLRSSELEQERLKDKLRSSNSEKDLLFQDLESSIDECTQLQQKLEQARAETRSMKETKDQFQTRVSDLLQQRTMEQETAAQNVEQVRAEVQEKQQESLDQLNQMNQLLQKELETLKVSSQETATKLDNSRKKVDLLKQQLSASRDECEQLKASVEVSQKELSKCKAERDSLFVAKQELEQKAVALQETVTSIKSKHDQSEQVICELRVTSTKLKEELKSEKEHSECTKMSLQEEVCSLQKAKKQSEDMVASMEFLLKQQQTKLEDNQTSLKSRQQEIKQLKSELENLGSQLVTEKSERGILEGRVATVTQQFNKNEEHRKEEVSALNQKIEALDSELSKLRDELQSTEASSEKYQILSSQLKATVDVTNNKKSEAQTNLDQALTQCKELERQKNLLESHCSRLKSNIIKLEQSADELSSENASLKKQLKETHREVDKLFAQVQAAEMNLEVANRSLEMEQKELFDYKQASKCVQQQYKESQEKLKDSLMKIQRSVMELHACKEERDKLKASLDLRHKESTELQQSLVETQSMMSILKGKISSLQAENSELSQTIHTLQKCQKEIQTSLEVSEKEHAENLKTERETVTRLSKEIEDYNQNKSSHLDQIKQLKRSLQESKSNVDQLLAAQEGLRSSLQSLGDEKEVEVMRLNSELSDTKLRNNEALKELSELKQRENTLQIKLREIEETVVSKEKQVENITKENERLTQEIEMLKSMEAEISRLHSKVDDLKESLHTKTMKLSEETQRASDLESKLKSAADSITEHQANLSELAKVKLELVENSTELEQMKKSLLKEKKARAELEADRDNLLTTLRKLQVEKHTKPVQLPTPQLPRGGDKEVDVKKLIEMLKDKEEEAQRLGEYVSKLLSNVVEKAPFVLENFT